MCILLGREPVLYKSPGLPWFGALQVSLCASATQSFVLQYPVSFMQPRDGSDTYICIYFGWSCFCSFSGIWILVTALKVAFGHLFIN